MGESQFLCLFDEITARVAFPSERGFRNDGEPLINVHRSTCTRENDLGRRNLTTTLRAGDIVPWGNRRFFRPHGRRGGRMSRVDCYPRFSASAEVGDASDPTRSAIETTSAN